jgi:hypothetical protein
LTISYSLKLTKLAILVIAISGTYCAQAQTTGIFRSAAGSMIEGSGEGSGQSSTPSSSQTPPAASSPASAETIPESPTPQNSSSQKPSSQQSPSQQSAASTPQVQDPRVTAAEQLRLEEKQRVLGVAPNFNVTYLGENTVPLSAGQKFNLAFHSSMDPFVFFAAAFDAALSQAENDFPGYGQGWGGYGKRLGASYADTVDGTILGNAVFPALLHQDPRYYRKGTGSFTSRLLYSVSTTVWCKNDNGKWGPNYSNVLGNLTAGGISNLYYPSTDRGVGLTFERGFTVTAEGTIGGVFDEFWPDIARKVLKKHLTQLQPPSQPPSPTPTGSPSPK